MCSPALRAPILLRHYAKLGAKLLGFNVDSKFSDALDGLILVDLRQVDPNLLERYMNKERAAGFLRRHGVKRAEASGAI